MRQRILPLGLLSTFALPAAAQCPDWSSSFGAPGINGTFSASIVFDDGSGPALYAAGNFQAGPNNPAGGILRWNGTSWSSVGTLPAGFSNSLAIFDDATGPKLVAGCSFSDPTYNYVGGVKAWNGQQWSSIGGALLPDPSFGGGRVLALAVYDDGTGAHLYAGGDFAGNILEFNGTSWVGVGGGLFNGPFDSSVGVVNALTVFDDGAGGGPALYAGGSFRLTGPWMNIGENIARTYGSGWVSAGALGGFDEGDEVAHLASFHDAGGAHLVATGHLYDSATHQFQLAQWNGTSWSSFTADVDGTVTCLRGFDASSGVAAGLWVAGNFTHAGTLAAARAARWDGAQWNTIGSNDAPLAANALEAFDDGSGLRVFALSGSANAALSNNHWSLLGGGAGANAQVTHLASLDDPVQGHLLFAAGDFSLIGQTHANGLAHWDGLRWTSELSYSYVLVRSLDVLDDGSGAKVFVTGLFGNPAQSKILRRDGNAWTELPPLPNYASATALTTFDDGTGTHLFVATVGPIYSSSYGVWRLDGATWTLMFTVDSDVTAFAVFDDGSGPALYLVGEFGHLGGIACNGIGRWNGQTLDDLGGGPEHGGYVWALRTFDDGSGPRLYAGGHFATMSGTPCSGLASWNGQAWSDVGGGVQQISYPVVYALSVHGDGSGNAAKLVVAGYFSSVGGQSASNIANWNGVAWSTLSGGVTGNNGAHASALASFDDGTGHGADLFVGGTFLTAGGHDSAYIARLTSCGGSATTFCYGDGSATACPCGNASPIGDRAGCLNSLGSGGTLRVSGRASIAHDTLELLGGGMTNSFALYYQGANIAFGGQGFVFGDGVKCLAGPFVRLRTKFNVNGASSYPNAGDASVSVKGFVATPGTRYYQIHYRNSAAFCTPETFNDSSAVSIVWEP